MSDKKAKLRDVTNCHTIKKSYRLIPYPDIVEILRKDRKGQAMVEGIDRRTAWSAKKILSERCGFPVKAELRIVLTEEDAKNGKLDGIEGYVFSRA